MVVVGNGLVMMMMIMVMRMEWMLLRWKDTCVLLVHVFSRLHHHFSAEYILVVFTDFIVLINLQALVPFVYAVVPMIIFLHLLPVLPFEVHRPGVPGFPHRRSLFILVVTVRRGMVRNDGTKPVFVSRVRDLLDATIREQDGVGALC